MVNDKQMAVKLAQNEASWSFEILEVLEVNQT